jgi:hypothetical protein
VGVVAAVPTASIVGEDAADVLIAGRSDPRRASSGRPDEVDGRTASIWLTVYARLVHRAHRVLTREDVRRWLERATGTVLIALGIRVAIERR